GVMGEVRGGGKGEGGSRRRGSGIPLLGWVREVIDGIPRGQRAGCSGQRGMSRSRPHGPPDAVRRRGFANRTGHRRDAPDATERYSRRGGVSRVVALYGSHHTTGQSLVLDGGPTVPRREAPGAPRCTRPRPRRPAP